MKKTKTLSKLLIVCMLALAFVFATVLTACGERYMIAFITNGGSSVESLSGENGETVEAPESPVMDGYVFDGWYLDSGLTEKFEFPYTFDGKSFNLYAKWRVDDYTVTFNSLGGSEVASYKAKPLEKLTPPADPVKADRLFAYWCVDEECTIPFDFVMPNRDITLYARWLKIEELSCISLNGWTANDDAAYEVTEEGGVTTVKALEGKDTWSLVGVTIGYNVKAYSTFVFDIEGTKDVEILIKCQNGGVKAVESRYKMTGEAQRIIWTVKPENLTDGQTAMNFYMFVKPGVKGGDATVKINGLKLYRTLADDEAYKSVIFYDTLGGTAVDPTFAVTGEKVTAPAAVPEKPGYTFSGWFEDKNCTKAYTFGVMPEGKTVLYAGYTANKSVTLTFNSNGGSEVAPITGTATGIIDKDMRPADPVKGDYIFGGWYEDTAFTKPYDISAFPAADLTVYARWCVLDEASKIVLDGPFVAKSGGYTIDGKTVSVGAGKSTYEMFGNQLSADAKNYAYYRITFTGTADTKIMFKCQNGGVKAVETTCIMTGEKQTFLWKVSKDNLPDGTSPMDFYMCIDPGKAYTDAMPDLKVTVESIELLSLKTV